MTEEDRSVALESSVEKAQNRKAAKKPKRRKEASKRTRTPRIYPALSFEASLALAEAIHTFASGERVARLTLLKQMNVSPTSSSTQILITSSNKYGITTGSFAADYVELTPLGRVASDKASAPRPK